MALIGTYNIDQDLTANDKWIGTDYNTGATKNYSPATLASFFNASNSIGVGGQVSFKFYNTFTGDRPLESITAPVSLPAFSAITALKIHKNSGGGNYCLNLINYYVGGDIFLCNSSNQNKFGRFKFLSITQDLVEPDFYNITLEFVAGNGALEHLSVYSISKYPSGGSGIAPTFQAVTTSGNTTTDPVRFYSSSTEYFEVLGNQITFFDTNGGTSPLGYLSSTVGMYLSNYGSGYPYGGYYIPFSGWIVSENEWTGTYGSQGHTITDVNTNKYIAHAYPTSIDNNYTISWRNRGGQPAFVDELSTKGLPSGGATGQILTKVDATDYNATWQDNYADWTSQVKHIVKNNGSALITKGTPVYATGSNGTNILVGKAGNGSESTSSKTMGLMQSDITISGSTQTGYVITEGLLGGLNTAGTTVGDPVWLGSSGTLLYGLINKPYAPAHLVFIGIITKVSAGNGEIFVKVQNGFELEELHNVDLKTNAPVANNMLVYDGSLWVNKNLADIAPERRNANNSSNNNINYCGTAPKSSAESSTVWTITKLTISSSGAITITSATNVAWTNRESVIYT